jgi:hypothetical protein
VLWELSQFTYLTSLMLYVHSPMPSANWLLWPLLSSSPFSNREIFFKDVFEGILMGRKNRQNFSVGFKEVRDWAVMHDNWQTPDWIFWLDSEGQLRQFKRDPEKEKEEERERLRRQRWANLTPQDLKKELEAVRALSADEAGMFTNDTEDTINEFQRRLKLKKLEENYGDDSATLYELLQPHV